MDFCLNIGSNSDRRRKKVKKANDDSCHVFIMLAISTADLLFDWKFLYDLNLSSSGQWGSIVVCICLFCFVGTVTWCLELVNTFDQCFDKECLSAVCVWCEDIPQICLSLLAAIYIEQPVAGVQWFKIALVLGNLLYLVYALFDGCCDSERSDSRMCIKTGTFTELVIAFFLAVVGWSKNL